MNVAERVRQLLGEGHTDQSTEGGTNRDVSGDESERVDAIIDELQESLPDSTPTEPIESARRQLQDVVSESRPAEATAEATADPAGLFADGGVAAATDDQAASAEEIASMIDQLTDQADEVADEIDEIAAATDEQRSKVENIRQSLREYTA